MRQKSKLPDYLPHQPQPERASAARQPLAFTLELTARCSNNCRHCRSNLPAGDTQARVKELSLEEIGRIAAQAVEIGATWCLLAGGEPLLREDFSEIYLLLKQKGLLVSVMTNACLVTREHIRLFQKNPPCDVEVSIFGATRQTYEGVTRTSGSYRAFRRGLNLLLEGGIKVRMRAAALRSNLHELPEMARICRLLSSDFYRIDADLPLRYDEDPQRDPEMMAERLSPAEILAFQQANSQMAVTVRGDSGTAISIPAFNADRQSKPPCCAPGSSFYIGFDGAFRCCSSPRNPINKANLREVNLSEAWQQLAS